ncbi:FAD dependent oxidoreductase [Ancylostoma duodenale]|uniref:L-2-hydroxyglutarate dehydrogenase, mitochondrial n=1 Tax=Ancylostoma duodenale TaxID=51022 RepID=A0A0C2GNZ7_9BILA|nr:FAD dependent oxidoreductase [Ancylostoma duodenale]
MEHPEMRICQVEKESRLAPHQSGNNSGVIHAGIYYTPGSLKAKLCVEGNDLAYKFFAENNFPHKKLGKLIVAVEPHEIPRLDNLFVRAQKNGCKDVKMIDGSQIKEYEPFCKGIKALWSPHTGVVDWGEVAKAFSADFEKKGGTVYINYAVKNITESADPMLPITIHSDSGNLQPFPIFWEKTDAAELESLVLRLDPLLHPISDVFKRLEALLGKAAGHRPKQMVV